jgi:hypothetical protein
VGGVGEGVGGGGSRSMTINNAGNVQFTGTVTAADFLQSSSLALKSNVRTLENALEMVNRLRGVRFDWKDSGKGAVGLIAEEVDQVLPEVVGHNEDGSTATGINYANLVAVLVEAVKTQHQTIERQQEALARQQQELLSLKVDLERLKDSLR